MSGLATSQIVHRDLSARNVLLSEQLHAKVADFGLSAAAADQRESKAGSSPVDTSETIGPVKWQAPEVISGGAYSEKSDVFAFGCTCIEIFTGGRDPYHGYKYDILQLLSDIRDKGMNPLALDPQGVPTWATHILQNCFRANPDDRWTFREVRYHLSRSASEFKNRFEEELDVADSLLSGSVGTSASSSALDTSDQATQRPETASNSDGTKILLRNPNAEVARRVDLGNVERLGKLGAGAFGAVFLGQSQGVYVALKELSSQGSEEDILKEASFMLNAKFQKNIVQLYGIISVRGSISIVMEFAPKGSLESYIKSQPSGSIPEGLLFKWALGIARGMAALSSSKIIHRDLATRNVLLDSSLEPKIADFGLARTVMDPNQESSTKTDVGPIRWFAPENFNLKYSEYSDVWSYGCTLVEIVTADVPLAHLSLLDAANAIREQRTTPLEAFERRDCPMQPPSWLTETMKKCFTFATRDRSSFADIVSFLEEVGPTIVEVRQAEEEIQNRRQKRAVSMRAKGHLALTNV